MGEKKKSKGLGIGFFTIVIIFFLGIMWLGSDDEIINEGEQTYTLMMYICGSDLETDGGYATTDIQEMLDATIDEKINVVIQTGGTLEWQNFGISSEANERYLVTDDELILIDDSLGQLDMLEPQTLTDFINYSKENYPADRYGLIMWDHGGGAISGFGYDETQGDEDTLTIDEMEVALNNAGVKFDFIGFDACLMATVETAYMVKGNADYLIASEELEPGTGWNYVEILNGLSANTDIETLELGKIIADSFIESNQGLLYEEEATLSVIETVGMDNLILALTEYMKEVDVELLATQQFNSVAKAIEKTKAFSYGEIDTIDLYHLAENLPTDQSENLKSQLENVIKYNVTTSIMEDSNGLSVYIPYTDLQHYSSMINIYNNLGITTEYTNVLSKIANIVAGGSVPTEDISGQIGEVESYQDETWYDESYINENEEYYEDNQYENLVITDFGEYYALELTTEDWEIINSITCEVLYDDGEGYIDLGSDDYFETTENGDLIVSFDGTWISLDGYIVPFYVLESTETHIKARVPAYLNDEMVDLIVVWDDKNPEGAVIGARPVSDYGDTTIETRRLIELEQGDKIEFLFDYYTYNLEYDDTYIIGEPMIVEDTDISVEYSEVGDGEFYVYYKITDIYNNEYYTEAIVIY